jgi:hypothetical protein
MLTTLGLLYSVSSLAQDEKEMAPVSRSYAVSNVNIIQAPGRTIDRGTVVLKNGLIVAVGKGISVPADAIEIKGDSMYVYAGFIDGLSHTGVTKPKDEPGHERPKDPGNPAPDKAGITPQVDVRTLLNPADKSIEEMRGVGFTVSQVVPYGIFLPGNAAIIQLGGSSSDKMVLVSQSALYSELTANQSVYPSTIMGVMAKWRELYRQSTLSQSYESVYAFNRTGLERPSTDRIHQAFYPVLDKKEPVLFKAEKMMEIHRVLALQSDLGFQLVLGNVKEGWDVANKIKTSGAKVFLSLDLPEDKKADEKKDEKKPEAKKDLQKGDEKKPDEKPKVEEKPKIKTAADVEKETLEKRKAEFIVKFTSQASVYQKAGLGFGFSSLTAKAKDIPANLRRIIAAGLSEDQALASLTTIPSQLLGLSDRLGTIDNGKIANLVITDKPYFNEKARVRYVFVDGEIYKMDVKESKKATGNATVDISGSWTFTAQTPQGKNENKISFRKDGTIYAGSVSGGMIPQAVDLKRVELDGSSLKFTYSLNLGGNTVEVIVEGTIDGDSFKGTSTAGQFGSFSTEGSKDPKN